MSHTCQALVISCMDFRLHDALRQWADAKYGPTGYDLVHLAGGAGACLKDDSQAVVLKQIELSQKLHSMTEVVLVNHWDCGAYGGSAAFNNDVDAERGQYDHDLQTVGTLIRERWPNLMTIEAIEQLDGNVEILRTTANA